MFETILEIIIGSSFGLSVLGLIIFIIVSPPKLKGVPYSVQHYIQRYGNRIIASSVLGGITMFVYVFHLLCLWGYLVYTVVIQLVEFNA